MNKLKEFLDSFMFLPKMSKIVKVLAMLGITFVLFMSFLNIINPHQISSVYNGFNGFMLLIYWIVIVRCFKAMNLYKEKIAIYIQISKTNTEIINEYKRLVEVKEQIIEIKEKRMWMLEETIQKHFKDAV
jgi:hydrogenase maturation factor